MKQNKSSELATQSQILFYQSEDGTSHIEVRLEEGTVWLSQVLIAELYQITKQTTGHHIRNIFDEMELSPEATVRQYLTVQTEGSRTVQRSIEYYNLDMILAIGYRVRSHRGTQFRRWATERLSEYLTKGFILDDERLKDGRNIGADYFDELLERIRDIRASEKRFYQKVKDIYTLAIDYDPNAETTLEFFKTVQNKLHWAITGRTAAEIIADRADADKPNMGLTSWKGAKVRKGDVTIAKNYLNETEIRHLNRLVTLVTQMLDLNKKLQEARLEQEKTQLSRQIEATDGAIDKLVYELYGLTGGECNCGGGREMKKQEKIAIQIKYGEIVNTPIVIDCMTI